MVIGGGGVIGVAWSFGVLAGLADAGADLSEVDLVIGTSAGASVGAALASGADLRQRYDAQLTGDGGEIPARVPAGMLLRIGWAMLRFRDARRFRARLGMMALRAATVSEAERRAVIEARLGGVRQWPARRLLVVAVDAGTGEFVAFDRDSGVPLVDAVTASSAFPGIWPPASLDGRRWIDGGVRSVANADLAAGHGRVVVLAPVVTGGGHLATPAAQVRELRRRARVALVVPDGVARRAIGRNPWDPRRRAAAARAGWAQAEKAAARVAEVWTA